MHLKEVRWGIIGCGAVTEVKSGPAFNKVPGSRLVAVMRRNASLAEDYALRHGVPRWYSQANDLVNDPEVNAIYIATPPDSHLEYTKLAMAAGKPVYAEKPMALNMAQANEMVQVSHNYQLPLVVAHYRRYWPLFQQVKALVDDGSIGRPIRANLYCFRQSLTEEDLQKPGVAWRINPAISGGGLFHDLAPHQLDLFRFWFGRAMSVSGFSSNIGLKYDAPDTVTGQILFEQGLHFSGHWCFCTAETDQRDECEILGTEGSIRFSVFWDKPVILENSHGRKTFEITPPHHNQIFLIKETVKFFMGERGNPCSGEESSEIIEMMDRMSGTFEWK